MELSAETIEKLIEIISEPNLERPDGAPCYCNPAVPNRMEDFGTSSEFGVCDGEGKEVFNESVADALSAIARAQMLLGVADYSRKTAEPTAKRITLPDDTVVYVVYDKDKKGKLFCREETTWCGGVPFEAGPRLTTVKLYEDHTAKVDAGRNYVSAVAWFYTEAEAQAYIDKAKGGAPC